MLSPPYLADFYCRDRYLTNSPPPFLANKKNFHEIHEKNKKSK